MVHLFFQAGHSTKAYIAGGNSRGGYSAGKCDRYGPQDEGTDGESPHECYFLHQEFQMDTAFGDTYGDERIHYLPWFA